MRYFESGHLRTEQQLISNACADLAHALVDKLEDSPELTAGLRKLLEAKDCFVRASLPAPPSKPWTTETGVIFELPK